MSFKRRLARLSLRKEKQRAAEIDELDRRAYQGAWRRFDRRAIAPALMGATMMMPSSLEAATTRTLSRADADEGARENGESVLRGERLYVTGESQARREAESFRGSRSDAQLLEYIASQPTATWFGEDSGDVARAADRLLEGAERANAVPVIVAYNIPNRDCGAHFAGGAGSAETYREWIRDLARGIGERDAIVILEPGALGLVSCLTHEGRSERFSLIREAVNVLKGRTNARVYIGAGHAQWVEADEMAQRLHLAGVERANGFALNVSSFVSTERNLSYGEQISRRIGGAHFVIDTGRNGGSVRQGDWCNPSGAALGSAPTTDTGHPLADAFLWVKPPGESDGTCNGGPDAGEWFAEYALDLARAAQRSGNLALS